MSARCVCTHTAQDHSYEGRYRYVCSCGHFTRRGQKS